MNDIEILEDIKVLENIKKLTKIEFKHNVTDREIQAIENLIKRNEELEDTLKQTQNSWYKDTKVIEKQSKEIEELKEKDDANLAYYDQIYRNGIYTGQKAVEYKIKAKIEEIDIEIQCCEYADDDTEEYKQDIEKEKRGLLRDKAVLQSLLEKE